MIVPSNTEQSLEIESSNLENIYLFLLDIRRFLENEFGVKSSTISMDIQLIVLEYYLIQRKPLTVKMLFAESKHSPTGIRYHLDGLIEDGWLSKSKNPNDKRNCFLNPGVKLINSLQKLSLVCNGDSDNMAIFNNSSLIFKDLINNKRY